MKGLPRWIRADERLTDEQAMGRVRAQGDHAAFARLVNRWQVPIRRLCIRMTANEHCGEDLAQEAFVRVFANRHQYDDAKRFSTWLWRIALNLCYEHGRSHSRRTSASSVESREPPAPLDEDDLVAGGTGPHQRAVESERAAHVRDALARLSEAHRAVVVLREYEGLKFREIADVLEVPEGTVKWRMSEALDELGRMLRHVEADAPKAPTTRKTKMRVTL